MTAEPEPSRVPPLLPAARCWGFASELSGVRAALSRGTIRRLWAHEVPARVGRWVVIGARARVSRLRPQVMGTSLLPGDRLLRGGIARLRGLAGPDLRLIARPRTAPT